MRTPFVFKLLFVAAGALAVVWFTAPQLLPLAELKKGRPVMDILKEKIGAATGSASTAGSQPAAPGMQGTQSTSSTTASDKPIVKCLINGKVLYTNDKCPHSAREQSLSLQNWSGVPTPNKDLLAEISRQREATRKQENAGQSRAGSQAAEPDSP